MDILAYLNAPVPRWLAMVAVVGTGVSSALIVGITMNQRFNRLFAEKVQEEVDNTVKFRQTLQKMTYPTAEEAAAELLPESEDSLEEIIEPYVTDDESGDDMVEVSRNVFTDMKDFEFDYDEEVKKRGDTKPYILTQAEFFEDECPTYTLTWFEDDEVLADEKDEQIPDVDKIAGVANLARFGAGSGDPNVLYIHNPHYDYNYEIVKNTGSYFEQHYGIQHSAMQMGGDRKRVLRMRPEDE